MVPLLHRREWPIDVLVKLLKTGLNNEQGCALHPKHYYKYCSQLSGPRFSTIVLLPSPEPAVVKTGPFVTAGEAHNMYTAQATSIPVPEIWDVWKDSETGWWCIWMAYIEGQPLDTVYDILNKEEKICVVNQLRGYIKQMRSLQPRNLIAAANGQPSSDQMLQQYQGIYQSEKMFRLNFVEGFLDRIGYESKGHEDSSLQHDTTAVAASIHTLPKDINDDFVFTHGNFTPRNIWVEKRPKGEGGPRVVAILDWSQSGYYPAYWEYVKASCCEQVEVRSATTGQVEASEPGFLTDAMPMWLFEDQYPDEARVFRKAYRMVWGYCED